MRVASLPTVYGEKIVIRLLDRGNVMLRLEQLGFSEVALARYTKSYTKPYGAILVTGPTGSGKSTTLYGTLNILNTPDKNIITVEDPVEYRLAGINQVQINPKAGLTFASGLRSILRCDPDIIMVGEIRDKETAQIAVESALDRPLGAVHPPHQRCARRAVPSDRDGRGTVLDRFRRRLRHRPASGPQAVRVLSRGLPHHQEMLERLGFSPEVVQNLEGYPALQVGRLRSLQRHGLQGAPRYLRDHAGDRGRRETHRRAQERR